MPRADKRPSADETDQVLRVSTLFISTLAVLHIANWAFSVVLGATAVWMRMQNGSQVAVSIFGVVGIGCWASVSFPICGILSIASGKGRSQRLISWFMLTAAISVLAALGIAIYCGLAIVNEVTASIPNMLIISSITAFVSFVEIITSTISFAICYNAIGLKCNFKNSMERRLKANGMFRGGRIGAGDDIEPGHVAVMALPVRQAADLFLAMYRPGSSSHHGFENHLAGQTFNQFPETFTGRFSTPPDEKRRHRKRRRPRHQVESPGIDAVGGLVKFESGKKMYEDETDTDQDAEHFRRPFSRQETVRLSTSDEEQQGHARTRFRFPGEVDETGSPKGAAREKKASEQSDPNKVSEQSQAKAASRNEADATKK